MLVNSKGEAINLGGALVLIAGGLLTAGGMAWWLHPAAAPVFAGLWLAGFRRQKFMVASGMLTFGGLAWGISHPGAFLTGVGVWAVVVGWIWMRSST